MNKLIEKTRQNNPIIILEIWLLHGHHEHNQRQHGIQEVK